MGARQSSVEGRGPVAPGSVREVGFEDFRILRTIGRGSFSKVCIAQKKDTGRMYAMKYMNKMACFHKGAFGNILSEMEILAELNHPFLVNLWFTFQDEEDMFEIFDLLMGGDLRYHLDKEGPFTAERVQLYISELSLALDYLRWNGIVHRDIKPDNLLLDERGHIHLTDFNVATRLGEDCLATSLSGTKPYMAPEVFGAALRSSPGYSFEADWWSLGVTAYELLRGRRPFELGHGVGPEEALELLRRSVSPLAVSSAWTGEMASFLRGLLQLDPGKRISSLEAVKSHLLFAAVDFKEVLRGRSHPDFVPQKDSLNCDPTFELEEMIIESRPLHEKKRRLRRRASSTADAPGEPDAPEGADATPLARAVAEMHKRFRVYNREQLLRDEEERVKKLEEELGLRPPIQEDAVGKRLGRF